MRLLLAEDERSLSKALIKILEKNNYAADAAYDGEEALAYLETGNYDGVILDIMMPKMDRLTVLKKIREAGNLIPVLMLTAKSEVEDKVTGLDGGANDYLTKPFLIRNCWRVYGYAEDETVCRILCSAREIFLWIVQILNCLLPREAFA